MKLRSARIVKDTHAFQRFNGIPFPPFIPIWKGYYRLENDPVEYACGGFSAYSQHEAYNLLLQYLKHVGVCIIKTEEKDH